MSTYRAIRTHIIPDSILDLAFRGHASRKSTVADMADTVTELLEKRLPDVISYPSSKNANINAAFLNLVSTIRELMESALQKAEEQKAWATQERDAAIEPAVLQSFKDWLKKVEEMPEMHPAKWNVIREGFLSDSALGKCF